MPTTHTVGYVRSKSAHFRLRVVICLLLVACTAGTTLAGAKFQGLGDLPGGAFSSGAAFVSADGGTVLGGSDTGSGGSSFIWTELGGMQAISLFPSGGFTSGGPIAITNDGTTMAGSGQSASGLEAFRWTQAGGVAGLGDLPGGIFRSQASAMSSDGSVIVGKSVIGPDPIWDTEAFRWTVGGGMVGLGDLPGGPVHSEATDVSADGSVIVGQGTIELFAAGSPDPFDVSRAFRWTETRGMVDLGSPAPGLDIFAQAVSADGAVVVGNTHDGLGLTMPFRWTEGAGMALLDEPLGGEDLARPTDVSGNGSLIVGQTFTSIGPEAIIWDQTNSVQYLKDVLTDLGLNLTGWTLEYATGISDDGLTIVGTGINPNGDTEAFIATLPEPASLALIALGLPALLRRGR